MGCETENFVFVIEDGVLKKFYLKTNCRYLIVPEGVLELDSGIFRDNLKFRVVLLPDSLKRIGDGAFEYAEALSTLRIPENVTDIGIRAFSGCFKLKSSSLLNRILSIGE